MSTEKLNNLIKFTEYDHLQPKQKPTNRTEIGGFSVLEGLSVKELVKLASEKSGMRKKELKEFSPKKLKKIIGEYKVKKGKPINKNEKPEVQDEEDDNLNKNESYLLEKKKSSLKQIAARKRFIEMISSNKKNKKNCKEDICG